ncbi:MAG: hypothetical protein HKN58_10095, partial [Xanthomonadales bacterium]|nr:hypothetical protein [Xanthomonadales bacterium]
SKYFPKQARRDVGPDGVPFEVTINAHGFRGRDYTPDKPPGTLRVVALGASSTFGFGNRDAETYPALLETLLNERLENRACRGSTRAEVINLGIPHLDVRQVSALFRAEGIAYRPDVVTLYSGYNDTRGLGRNALLTTLSRRSLVANFLRVLRQQSTRISPEELTTQRDIRVSNYLRGLDEILATARLENMALVPLTQQATSLPPGVDARKGVTYPGEMVMLQNKLETAGQVSLLEGKLLIHGGLMRALAHWAAENGLETVDIIGLLDHHRYLLNTYVHLSPLGNDLIALAIADRIAEQLDCPVLATP